MKNSPLISIITISYNVVSTIEETILSVINQTYSNIEYIIIDGNSTDGTVDIIKKYSDKISYWESKPDKGIYDAMNKGIHKATGKWINFMNAGDRFYDNYVLENFIPKISPTTDIAYGNVINIYSLGEILSIPQPLDQLTRGMVFSHQATFITTDLHKKNLFDTSFKSSADYNFFYQMYKQYKSFEYIPITVAYFDAKTGMSKDCYHIVKREDARIHGKDKNIFYIFITELDILKYKFNQILKQILPQKIVKHLQNRNYKKLLEKSTL